MAKRDLSHRPGQIGRAIARRLGEGKHIVLADMRQDNANAGRSHGERRCEVSVAYDRGLSGPTRQHSG